MDSWPKNKNIDELNIIIYSYSTKLSTFYTSNEHKTDRRENMVSIPNFFSVHQFILAWWKHYCGWIYFD